MGNLELKPGAIVRGDMFPEPVEVIQANWIGDQLHFIGTGIRNARTFRLILSKSQVAALSSTPESEPFDGDSAKFKLGIEATRLGLAYEYDPYFSLSIARVDPLPHQLEAVYDYFLKLPRIRFLLADDPGAGKTIMAGLLIKELKLRGLVQRILIVTPANLSFQWQRELKDKFREQFEVIRSDVLRANYGMNPFQEKNQVITSVSWVSTIEDAKESLLRSQWDLIIVDEAHKMSAQNADRKTLAFQLGEKLSEMTDHFLMMTATPHKGDPQNFCLFLSLLDKDVYGDIKSLEEAMRKHEAPFYLRRVKEALKTFPDPDTGVIKALFTKRNVQTTSFKINQDEDDFYCELTRFVEDQSIKASEDNSARSRALGFTMAMLQRRFASSTYAVRRSLERMMDRREEILKDPEAWRNKQIQAKLPDNFDEMTDEERERVWTDLEDVVASYNPADLREEIQQLGRLVRLAKELQAKEVESKLVKLHEVLDREGLFKDPNMKLLLFTEHKDTLDYLAGDGKDKRPLGKLREWGLSVTQIYGGMKIGDRDTPGTRIYAEREFRESCQVLVATEAAGEGINLQFCWFMINYDIPWNPVRLEQRMGRIHRYGQEKDCLIVNFVAENTREGRVLQKLLQRISQIEEDLDPEHTGKVFNVVGDVIPPNYLERMLRDLYARNLTEDVITSRIIKDVDPTSFRQITESTLEGLAKRELNLSAIIGKSAEAKERRLVPEAIQDFFTQAAPVSGVNVQPVSQGSRLFKVGKVPRTLWKVGEELEPRFGKLGKEYKKILFDKKLLVEDPTSEWVTPGHPLFEALREDVLERVHVDLGKGAIFYDLNRTEASRLDVYTASILDGKGSLVHKRLFVVETHLDGSMELRQPTLFLDINPMEKDSELPQGEGFPDKSEVEAYLLKTALLPFLDEVQTLRTKDTDVIKRHLKLSLNAIIDRAQQQFIQLQEQKDRGASDPGLDGRIQIIENRLMEYNDRLERRLSDLRRERECAIGDIRHLGRAWVLPSPKRKLPEVKVFLADPEIERIAVDAVIAQEKARGWQVESVEKDNKGFDLISRKPHPEDPATSVAWRFIEVKGRSGVGEVALSPNEYKAAVRLGREYWLYVVFNCSSAPQIHEIQDPVRLNWKPIEKIVDYRTTATSILMVAQEKPEEE